MRKMIKTINAILSTINITILFVIVLCVTWQVMARFIFKSPSIITDELSRLLFIYLGLLGGAYTAGQNRHLAIDLLPMSLTGKPKQILFRAYPSRRYWRSQFGYGQRGETGAYT